MLTPFGKLVRKLRIDKEVLLKQMADHLGVKSSYLSAVESGRKNITDDLLNGAIAFFNLDPTTASELRAAADRSQRVFKIQADESCDDSRLLAAAFARNFNSLSDDKRQRILSILGE